MLFLCFPSHPPKECVTSLVTVPSVCSCISAFCYASLCRTCGSLQRASSCITAQFHKKRLFQPCRWEGTEPCFKNTKVCVVLQRYSQALKCEEFGHCAVGPRRVGAPPTLSSQWDPAKARCSGSCMCLNDGEKFFFGNDVAWIGRCSGVSCDYCCLPA